MIKKHSDDPDVAAAALEATDIIRQILYSLSTAETFDYGGHDLHLDDYGMCTRCTSPIAEAQQASRALLDRAEAIENPTVAEHVALAGELLRLEAEAARIRAELHSGQASEPIVNELLGFIYHRSIHDAYEHTHNQGQK